MKPERCMVLVPFALSISLVACAMDDGLGSGSAAAIGGPLGDVIGSNDLGHGRMRWDLDANATVWHVTNNRAFPNTIAFNGVDVFNVTGDAAGNPLPVERVNVDDGATLSTLTLVGNPGGRSTHIEDMAFTSATDLWGADIFNNRLVRWDITTGQATLTLPITGSFSSGAPVFQPTGIAATPLGMYASLGFGAIFPPEIGIIDVTTGVYTPVFVETGGAPNGFFYVHSLAYDSSRGVLWENISFGGPAGSQILRQRFLDGTSAGPDVTLNPAPVQGRFDGFEHLSVPVQPGCGDGNVDPGEECDDGNNIDGDGCSATCTLENSPPDCSGAAPSAGELWPPNHVFASVSVDGVTDPDGDAVTIAVTGVTQDEPTDGLGDGSSCPDAQGIGTGSAQLRRERSGNADGRVYHISFTATDELGAECTGTVSVCVPHDQGPGHACVDQGPLHDSTACAMRLR